MLYKIATFSFIIATFILKAEAQHTVNYNLPRLLKENKLITGPFTYTQPLPGGQYQGISSASIVLLKDVTFKEGTIDIDLRGKDVFLQSFLGIAFHAKDTLNYQVIYFRPFRFYSTDTATRRWSVQYMSMPGYDYQKLRKEHPLKYESQVNPVPNAADWFHVTIIIKDEWITVYVNHSNRPSLKIKEISNTGAGMIGLWASGLSEDFANLTLTR